MSRDEVKAVFNRIMGEFLFPLLESRGYRAKGKDRYVLVEGDNEYHVGVRLHHPPRSDLAAIFVSASVAFRRLWQFLKPCSVFARANLYSVTGCGGLIINMFPRDLAPSWSLFDANSSPEALGQEMVGQFQKYVFPYVEHFSHLDNALTYWAGGGPFDRMARAAALLLRGQRDQAFKELDERIAEAEQEYQETLKPGHAERVAEFRRFRAFLATA